MITRINHNRGRRFLNPFEIESQYVTEDRTTNPDLLMWYDFTDPNSMETASGDPPEFGDEIAKIYNKAHTPGASHAGVLSAGDKALGSFCSQSDSSKRPVYYGRTSNYWQTPLGARFNNGDFLAGYGNSTNGGAGSSVFSTSTLTGNNFCIYVVGIYIDTSPAQFQDYFQLLSETSSLKFQRVTYNDQAVMQHDMYDAARSDTSTPTDRYRRNPYQHYSDVADVTHDEIGAVTHYHFINYHEIYNNQANYCSLQRDGHHNNHTEYSATPDDFSDPFFSKLWVSGYTLPTPYFQGYKTGGFDSTFSFANTEARMCLGGQTAVGIGTVDKGTFNGHIMEILIFKSEHGGPSPVDNIFYSRDYKRRWSNMLYYFYRKYSKIDPKN